MRCIAQERFIVVLKDWPDIDVELKLHKGDASDYGNKTCTEVLMDGKQTDILDTRYVIEIGHNGEGFADWCWNYLKDRFGNRLKGILRA